MNKNIYNKYVTIIIKGKVFKYGLKMANNGGLNVPLQNEN